VQLPALAFLQGFRRSGRMGLHPLDDTFREELSKFSGIEEPDPRLERQAVRAAVCQTSRHHFKVDGALIAGFPCCTTPPEFAEGERR
jgi:hypothetical protein